ncbi:flavodoxin family protein [Methanogenium organophilum]|uniref:Flavodoxin family protein n=1 Tax=Methanogenium organophilum TaxID=2199 RepID=A0A9X9S6M3_METOG|nr:flavodoxin family protein [Methanogenium organophilum]WAI02407.1 flavodoxin family protein [Methanogenium organophilum]
MKVVAFNASPRKEGNTMRLLRIVCDTLEEEGIETEIVHIGGKKVNGCIACMKCAETLDRRCAITGDPVNEWMEKMYAADGIIIGSPTYFADLTTEAKALIDRAGFVGLANGGLLRRKVGAAVVAVRRAGAIHVYDSINHLFGISEMVTVGSTYWNLGMGLEPGDVESDQEGRQTMIDLGKNMAWVLKKLNA